MPGHLLLCDMCLHRHTFNIKAFWTSLASSLITHVDITAYLCSRSSRLTSAYGMWLDVIGRKRRTSEDIQIPRIFLLWGLEGEEGPLNTHSGFPSSEIREWDSQLCLTCQERTNTNAQNQQIIIYINTNGSVLVSNTRPMQGIMIDLHVWRILKGT